MANRAELTRMLMENPACLRLHGERFRQLLVPRDRSSALPDRDFALVESPGGGLVPKLVEIQAFPSVYGYQDVLCSAYRDAYGWATGWIFLSD